MLVVFSFGRRFTTLDGLVDDGVSTTRFYSNFISRRKVAVIVG